MLACVVSNHPPSTSYVDLMLVHFPNYNDTVGNASMRQDQWRAMEAFFRAGKARAIGVSHHCQRHMQVLQQTVFFSLVLSFFYK